MSKDQTAIEELAGKFARSRLGQPTMPHGYIFRPAHRADGCPHDETPEQLAKLKRHFPTLRDAVSYIMDTFPIVRRKDESAHSHYRTKDTILEIHDAMRHSITTATPYQTRLNPPPADPRCCHPPKKGSQA
ncbi:MAG: hypothetical protein NTX50_17565 [Candidatus Sumerlaeota bacterium]|nr:hypothetical protein [Candidatus Sumerlaeota bacterium]